MKKCLIILVYLFSNSGLLFSQEIKNSLGNNFVYPQFHENFSAEESWEIHKEAYKKQLKKNGLTDQEIDRKMVEYEKEKKLFLERINNQSEQAAIQRKEAELMRKKAEEQRKDAEILRAKAEQSRKEADVQRQKADDMRKQAEQARKESAVEREKAEEQRKQALVQRERAEKQRVEADVQRKKAEEMRIQAEEQRKKAEKLRNSFENILTRNIEVYAAATVVDPIRISVDKKTTLYFSINSRLKSGNMLVEIINPRGEKEAELSMENKPNSAETLNDEFTKFTNGSISKTIADTEAGDWQIRIFPEKAEGTVSISVARYIKPSSDE
ncbi:hypothetical protein [Anditalea andensis]|uniref:Uncharacterized protein n=1 Tax=Anditalea andensis TaxID=1048983 RepID=A0A074KZ09_9BACT|nr:hypothetical protein [Anditalea andensis]KEO75206.1 hypothetical protein EL17_05975 [Anditalea andensis]